MKDMLLESLFLCYIHACVYYCLHMSITLYRSGGFKLLYTYSVHMLCDKLCTIHDISMHMSRVDLLCMISVYVLIVYDMQYKHTSAANEKAYLPYFINN